MHHRNLHDRFSPRRGVRGALLLLALGIATATAAPSSSAQRAVVELLNRAAAAVERGELESADAALERALRIDATDAAIWRLLAQVRRLRGDTAQSEALLAKARGLNYRPQETAAPRPDGAPAGGAVAKSATPAPASVAARPPQKRARDAADVEPSNAELARRLRLQHARLRLAAALAAAR